VPSGRFGAVGGTETNVSRLRCTLCHSRATLSPDYSWVRECL